MRRIIIVGASLAGLRTAQALRAEGFGGTLTLVGAEPYPPYDRPPLSKKWLAAGADDAPADDPALPIPAGLDAKWLLGTRAVGLDPAAGAVHLEDGGELAYDGLVIATGAAARPLPTAGTPPPEGVFTLRDRDDADALRAELRPGRRITVVGGGLLGSEVAATARHRGLEVTLVVSTPHPLERLIGEAAGRFVTALHRAAGITVVVCRSATGFRDSGRLAAVELSDGTEIGADLAVLALGTRPNAEWLAAAGLVVDEGVLCDEHLRVLRADGTPARGIVAAGDVVSRPHPLTGGTPIRLGHWNNAAEQAAAAAYNLLHPARPRPFAGVPSFWCDLHGVTLRAVGLPAIADEVRVAENALYTRKLEITYARAGRLVGALTVGRNGRLAGHRRVLAESLMAIPA
ncbi:FAD-dependent oxidoreductase [Embleya scabrispora]|uniref:FAD-dependent oxidoreductase n=1 Tax=Embleya scabrispora TaxID=159449 RepID=A0A1T3NJX1_9ACTN|nr:FAD-dependent oxidoreductase [Embleya scabrispora]OPC77146.1 FAD-dependent oxidoreductase [Embleya scabrispora]